jgi:hypothetical protein
VHPAEVAAEEDEADAISAVQTTDLKQWSEGLKQWLEGLRDPDKNALHLANVLHALHEVDQV